MEQQDKHPRLAKRLLLSFLRNELAEEVLGDLQEQYLRMEKGGSSWKAKLNYWYQVIQYLRPFAIRKGNVSSLIQSYMIANYTKITLRNLVKQKLYAFLNIGGLAVGLSAFLMIALFIQYEFSYDRFLSNAEGIYRIYQKQKGNNYMGSEYYAVTPIQVATALPEELPEIKHATRLHPNDALLVFNDKTLWENGIQTDEHFFDVFPFKLVKGNASQVLSDPKSIVLTENLATKIFGDVDPIGKVVQYDNESTRVVSGVIRDLPENSSLRFSFIVNFLSDKRYAEELRLTKWDNNSHYTFFTLNEGSKPADVEGKFPALLEKYHDKESYKNYPFKDTYYVQPFVDMHLATGFNFDIGVKGNRTYVYVFGAIGLLVLILACINYMNLAIARSIGRAKEVGLRKVVGALRKQLIFQFLGESIFISFLAFVVAIGLTFFLLPYFGRMVERNIQIDFIQNRFLIPSLLGLVLIVGLLSGSYPALAISALRPAMIIKGKVSGLSKGFSLQRILIVAQFCVSIVLVTSSIVIYQQMQYVKNKDLGFSKDHVLVIRVRDRSLFEHFEALRAQWLQNTHVSAVAAAEHLPTNIRSSTLMNNGDEDKSDDIAIYQSRITADYLDVFGLKLIAGRAFSAAIKTDYQNAQIINETAAKALGWTAESAIGKQFRCNDADHTVIGVVRDFNLHNLHLPVEPVMLSLYEPNWGSISLKITPDNLHETIALVEKSVKPLSPYPFEYEFLEDSFNQMYKEDLRIGETFGFFTFLSLTIAGLGLFGLAAFVSGQRTREIGIRKVLGASVQSIVYLISTDFLKLVLLAFVVSVPLAWYAMHQWLEGFAYKIELQWWMFGAAGLLALIVAKIAIGYQSLKASFSDPVSSLKAE